ncbi:MAG: substrate-binding domain-containing protein [Nitrospiraceae bacterium]
MTQSRDILGRTIRSGLLVASLLASYHMTVAPEARAAMTGRIVVAGYGPELPVLYDLGRAYEKANPGTAIDFEWDRNVKAVELVKTGEAQIAVTGNEEPTLDNVHIAWDGIAVIVNFANPVKEVTSQQVAGLLTGRIKRWSELAGADSKVELIQRSADDNLQTGLASSLGLKGHPLATGKATRSDETALRAVSGKDAALSYLSLGAALKAQEDGIPIQILTIDKVEPGEPTVRNGRYELRRPVVFVTAKQPDSLTQSFVAFALSPVGQRIVQTMYVPRNSTSKEVDPHAPKLTDKKKTGSGQS